MTEHRPREPEHLRRGRVGEAAAKRHLKRAGLKFLTANFRTKSSEIDLVFRDGDCLVFVEVKVRPCGGERAESGSGPLAGAIHPVSGLSSR